MIFKNLSLSKKLYASILLFLILPLLVAVYILNNVFADYAFERTSENALQTLVQSKHNFDVVIQDTESLSIQLLAHDDVQKLGKGQYRTWSEYDRLKLRINDFFDQGVFSDRYYDSITIYSDSGILYNRGESVEPIEENLENYAYQLQGQGFWHTKSNSISYYRAIMDFQQLGKTIGIQRLDLSEDMLYQFYNYMNTYENSFVSLIDNQGNVLSSSLREHVGDVLPTFDSLTPYLTGQQGYFVSEFNDAEYVNLYYKLEETDWIVLQQIPSTTIMSFNQTVHNVLIWGVVLIVFFGLVFSAIQKKYIVNPLRKIVQEMDKVKEGNFDVQLVASSQDEIGQLSHGFVDMSEEIERTINEVYLTKVKQTEAEFRALESQINPHFLYNTLDSIHWLALKEGNYDVSEQIEALADIFRHMLNKGEQYVTIEEEVDFLENYLFIQEKKYGERIKSKLDIDPELLDTKILKLLIQPLVENAFVHGLENILGTGIITIQIKKQPYGIQCVVEDNGAGMDGHLIRQKLEANNKEVFALKNINERIQLKYGKKYGLQFQSEIGVGTRVELTLPLWED